MARRADPDARDRILDVASALFASRGIGAVGMAEVVHDAGCGKNLLYTHFPSKGDLVAAHLERFRRERDAAMDAAVTAAGDDPRAQLLALVRESGERVARPGFRGCPLRNFLTESPDVGGDGDTIARRFLADSRERLARLVARLGVAEPDVLTDRLALLVEGLYASAHDPRRAELGPAAVTFAEELVDAARAAA
ncbi:TetR/AcrR family transcriptional regulator [Pseudonocardia benzenivorans]|uniref:Regulatory protein TetR n=2 Tax=Pseudonocardia TaxID=1847 RepID=F4CUY4_PSEUX|nr:TetR/AcrR family transcriptional regulator [Pseudonocardia dioxanivorans]AEA27453.1 regulatory protein TetR [Pseudonocardia dioxanivorans CB1190]